MEHLVSILSQEWLLGILVGFGIAELAQWTRKRTHERRLKRNLRAELEANRRWALLRADTVIKMIEALQAGTYLPGKGIGPFVEVFDGHYASILHRFKPIERDNIHIIYEGLKTYNELLDDWESTFIRDLETKIMADPFVAHQELLQNIREGLLVSKELIENFLSKQPRDVLYRALKRFPAQFSGPAKPDRSVGPNTSIT
ncbi:MAG: hypothetical protein IH855_03595 [Bacteroidetes bacterium]|nr:hypothetical protein [Bacteroidota bacterium]